MSALVRIAGIGAVTPVGLSAPATFTALQAGIARLGEIGSFVVAGPGAETQPLVGGRVPLELFDQAPEGELTDYPGHAAFELPRPAALATYLEDGPDRLARMLGPAIDEALADAGWERTTQGTEAWIAVDAADAGEASQRVLRAVVSRVFAARGVSLAEVRFSSRGRAGALAGLEAAPRSLAVGSVRRVLLAGVGSLVRPREAALLEAFGNLRSADRPRGVHPGECAAALALDRGGDRAARALVRSSHVAEERAARGEPTDARALSGVLAHALAAPGGKPERPLVVCDLNGDRYRGIEWGLALVRALSEAGGPEDVWHPAESIGDAGAGLGALDLAWAAHAVASEQTEHALVWGASDDGLRAACLLGAPATGTDTDPKRGS